MSDYVLNQILVKVPINQRSEEILAAIAFAFDIADFPSDIEEINHINEFIMKDYRDAKINQITKLENLHSNFCDIDFAPKDTPSEALIPRISTRNDCYVLYVPSTESGGYIKDDGSYSDGFFNTAISVSLEILGLFREFNYDLNDIAIAYDSKSENESYIKRPFKTLYFRKAI